MTADQTRKKVIKSALARKGKNQYSQDAKLRLKVDTGYGDCSSTARHHILKIAKIDIGGNTSSQILNEKGIDIDVAKNSDDWKPDISKLKIADTVYFKGSNKSRPLGVGHVETVSSVNYKKGTAELFGHGSGIGGRTIDLATYCKQRHNNGIGYIKTKRWILDDVVYK